MSKGARPTEMPRRPDGGGRYLPYVLIAGAVALGWQIAIQPLKVRAPVELAVRLTPNSAIALGRAAESELAANRDSNAAFLARESLMRAPFSVRAMRVMGLAEARSGRVGQADEMITLAGNWSLRDDPSHAWLIEHRLRRGNYGSALAHADTLLRRRDDLQPQIFRLFTMAGSSDPQRALPVIAHLMSSAPPWRTRYWHTLPESSEGLTVAANLAILLDRTSSPVTNGELGQLYVGLTNGGQIEAVKLLRSRLGRPADTTVTNGDFESPDAPLPFQWALSQQAGATALISAESAGNEDHALRVEYDGFVATELASQRMFLNPGHYRLTTNAMIESGEPVDRLAWLVSCAGPAEASLVSLPAVSISMGSAEWATSSVEFTVPNNCASQVLALRGRSIDRRLRMAVWFDDIAVTPSRDAPAPAGRTEEPTQSN